MDKTIIDSLYEDNQEIDKYLEERGEISFRNYIDSNFRKTLLLSAASYFESTFTENILELIKYLACSREPLVQFVRRKAIDRQYHTYFDWKSRNANVFFGLFGSDFKAFMQKEINADSQLESAISAFIELGQIRNQLVHQNFAEFYLDKTVDEIYKLYRDALVFVELFPLKLKDYLEQTK